MTRKECFLPEDISNHIIQGEMYPDPIYLYILL